MSRIQKKFASLKGSRQKALIPYITPEYPFKGITLGLLRALEEGEADLVEVGIPFSDPLADGETIQHSSEFALKNGVTVDRILDAVREFRKSSQLPILLMGYVNPIFRIGVEKFFASLGVWVGTGLPVYFLCRYFTAPIMSRGSGCGDFFAV